MFAFELKGKWQAGENNSNRKLVLLLLPKDLMKIIKIIQASPEKWAIITACYVSDTMLSTLYMNYLL